MERQSRTILLIILIVAVGLRLGWGLSRSTDESSLASLPDQREYLQAGRNVLAGEGLRFTDERFGQELVAFRAPGYPLLIALCGGNVRILRIVQALLDTSVVLAIYLLARAWLSPKACLFAAALVAVNPFLIYFTGLVLTETLFTALLAWGMALLICRGGRWWLAGALLLALSIHVRPGALLLPLLLSLLAALANKRTQEPYLQQGHRWPVPVGATVLLLTLIMLIPWGLRNHHLLGRWVWTTTNAGFSAYDGFNPDATGASDQSFVKVMPQLRDMTEVERSDYLSEKAKSFAREHQKRALELAAIKIGRTWSPSPLSEQFSRPLYVAIAWLYTIPLWLLVLAGVRYGSLPLSAKVFLLIPAIYVTAGAALTVGSLRYRVPAEPPMAVLAASFAPWVFKRAEPDAG